MQLGPLKLAGLCLTQQSPARNPRACSALRVRKWPGKAARQFKRSFGANFLRILLPLAPLAPLLVFIASCGCALRGRYSPLRAHPH